MSLVRVDARVPLGDLVGLCLEQERHDLIIFIVSAVNTRHSERIIFLAMINMSLTLAAWKWVPSSDLLAASAW